MKTNRFGSVLNCSFYLLWLAQGLLTANVLRWRLIHFKSALDSPATRCATLQCCRNVNIVRTTIIPINPVSLSCISQLDDEARTKSQVLIDNQEIFNWFCSCQSQHRRLPILAWTRWRWWNMLTRLTESEIEYQTKLHTLHDPNFICITSVTYLTQSAVIESEESFCIEINFECSKL